MKRLTLGLVGASVLVSGNVAVREGVVVWAFYLLLVVLVAVGAIIPLALLVYVGLRLLSPAKLHTPAGEWAAWLILAIATAALVGIEAVYRAGPIYGWVDLAMHGEGHGWWSQ